MPTVGCAYYGCMPDLPEPYAPVLWDITCPKAPGRVPGVSMAGFGDRGITPSDLRLIPHPSVTLLVFDGSISLRDSSGRAYAGSFVTGLGFGDALQALRTDTFACLQVRLSPLVARMVLGPEVAELDGGVATLDEVIGTEADRIAERLNGLACWDERFALVDDWLAGRSAAGRLLPEVSWAWQRIVAGRGDVRIEDLADELGWSRKRLWTRFGAQVGMPPKRAAKLVRFDHAVHRLVAGHEAAAVAADGGYADQSHLHRDVKEFTGLTPATVISEPFLAVDDLAWGWPRMSRHRASFSRSRRR